MHLLKTLSDCLSLIGYRAAIVGLACLVLACSTSEVHAQTATTHVDSWNWKTMDSDAKLPNFAQLHQDSDQGDVLKVMRTPSSPQQIGLLTIDAPKLKERFYRLEGKIRYEGVDMLGFLEMWSTFEGPQAGAHFTRTLDLTGPTGHIVGDSGWRDFQVPFMVNDLSVPLPAKLQLNLVLPGKGTVWLTDVQLSEGPLPVTVNPAKARPVTANAGPAVNIGWMTYLFPFVGLAGVAFGGCCFYWMVSQQQRNLTMELRRMEALNIE